MEAVLEKEEGAKAPTPQGNVIAGTVRAKAKKRSRKKRAKEGAQGKKNQALGKRGEDAATSYLFRRGYEILERNWECIAGEADIIARDGDVLVFVEVKTRSDLSMGFPSEHVTRAKRERYEKIAAVYLADRDFTEMIVRFDVVGILVLDEERVMVRHHISAFSAENPA